MRGSLALLLGALALGLTCGCPTTGVRGPDRPPSHGPAAAATEAQPSLDQQIASAVRALTADPTLARTAGAALAVDHAEVIYQSLGALPCPMGGRWLVVHQHRETRANGHPLEVVTTRCSHSDAQTTWYFDTHSWYRR